MNKKFFRRIGLGSLICALVGLCACNSVSGSPSRNNSGPPTIIFSANTNTIPSGQIVTLSWNATNATTVTITASTGPGSASRTVITSPLATGTQADKPTQTTTYTAVATGSDNSTSSPQTATVQVVQPAAQPQITAFTASPMAVNSGQTTTITWTTTNATSVTITPPVAATDDTGSLPTSGSSIVPVISTTTFTINASGPGGTAVPNSVTVEVPFTLTLIASPSTIITGQSSSVTLTWQVTGGTATALSIDNGVCDSCALPQGTATVTPTSTTTYTATATAVDGGKITQSATVTVSSGSSTVIKHIFFLLQENRSFDMYFGQLGAYRVGRLGMDDGQTINGFDPNVTLTKNHSGVHVKPFHEATVCTENLSPAWDESHHDTSLTGGDSAWNSASPSFTDTSFGMAGFLDTTGSVSNVYDPNGTRPMGYYNQQDLPYYYDLATFFATSDSWHSPILGNTVPNRMYLMAATSFGHEYPDFSSSHPKYVAPTIFRTMNTANVSWLYYYKDGIFLANFADFQDPKIGPKTFPISDLMSRLTGSDADKALPEVIFIDSASGSSGLDEHPDHNVQTGAAYVKSIIDALMQSNAWQDSAFILSYDEGGGLYDQLPPFVVPPPDLYAPGQCPDPNNGSSGYCTVGKLGGQTNQIGVQQFGLTGFRVPLIVISPYAKPHFISHTPRDYTAILAFIEETFKVPSLTARDAYWKDPSRDMSEFFDFTNPALTTAPGGVAWPNFLSSQPTNGVCDETKEAGPTF